MGKKAFDINAVRTCQDPREMPIYSIPEAAQYLTIPQATLRSWVLGMNYPIKGGEKRRFQPVISLPRRDTNLLSFYNLAEAHVLRAFREQHGIQLKHIRKALTYVKKEFQWKRPLIEQAFQTDGVRLLVERLGQLVDASADGQIVMRQIVAHLKRLEWEDSIVACLYPFTRGGTSGPRRVLIDPRFSFGRPILKESRVETGIIAERYKAGDSIHSLAQDYGCARIEIEEGLRCELCLQEAA